MSAPPPEPEVLCCADFDRDLVVWAEPEYDWSRRTWCIKQIEYYGEVSYHPVRHCPWCGLPLPVVVEPARSG